PLLTIRPAGGSHGGRRGVLGLANGDEPENRIHQLQVAFDLVEALGARTVLEQDVEPPPLLLAQAREAGPRPLSLRGVSGSCGPAPSSPPLPAPGGSERVSHSGDPPCVASHGCSAITPLPPSPGRPSSPLRRQGARPLRLRPRRPPRRPRWAAPRRSAAVPGPATGGPPR